MLRKHNLMYELFGKSEGVCKDCKHYTTFRYRDKIYRKCEVYGITKSEGSDWKANAGACGLFPDKPYNGRKVIELVARGKQREDHQVDGQISLF